VPCCSCREQTKPTNSSNQSLDAEDARKPHRKQSTRRRGEKRRKTRRIGKREPKQEGGRLVFDHLVRLVNGDSSSATCPVLSTSTATGDAPAAAVSEPADRVVSRAAHTPRPKPIGRDLIGCDGGGGTSGVTRHADGGGIGIGMAAGQVVAGARRPDDPYIAWPAASSHKVHVSSRSETTRCSCCSGSPWTATASARPPPAEHRGSCPSSARHHRR